MPGAGDGHGTADGDIRVKSQRGRRLLAGSSLAMGLHARHCKRISN